MENNEELNFDSRIPLTELNQSINAIKTELAKIIIGQDNFVELLIVSMLVDGHVLIEGVPGIAKTITAKLFAKTLKTNFSRIQFTPDLMPSDILGTSVFNVKESDFEFKKGPIFSNVVLIDEINRAPAKTQAALFETMEERQATIDGTTYKMAAPFMVLATQNPIEQEGTYPLPEAQMDRFLMHVIVNYPDKQSEIEVLNLIRSEEGSKGNKSTVKESLPQDVIFNARNEILGIHVSEAIQNYIVDIVNATRYPEKYSENLALWIDYGASPRASIALDKCSRVNVWLNERDFVSPEDVRAVVHDILRHRISSSYEANAEGISKTTIIDELLKQVAVA